MKFYRVHFRTEDQASAGFSFFTTKRAAEDAVANDGGEGIEEINVEPTRLGIFNALNCYAAHPDNG